MSRPAGGTAPSAGILSTAVHRARSDWPIVLAAWLLLVCATGLVTTAASYSESVTTGGYRRLIESAAPSATAVRVHAKIPAADLYAAGKGVAPAIAEALGPDAGSVSLVATTSTISLGGVDPSDLTRQIAVGSYEDIASHAGLVSGRWAEPGRTPLEANLSTAAASALGLAAGDTTTLVSKTNPKLRVEILIAGLWQPDAGDRYWLGGDLELRGVVAAGKATTRGPFTVAASDLTRLVPEIGLDVEWRWLPAIDRLDPERGAALRTSALGLGDGLTLAFPGLQLSVESGLPPLLATANRADLVTQSSLIVLFAQFALLAGYAILLVAGVMVESRRAETALLRARGATTLHLARLALGESLVLTLPAVVVAPFAAQGFLALMRAAGPLAGTGVLAATPVDEVSIAAALAGGAACVLALTLPALPWYGELSGIRSTIGRQLGRTMTQRLGLDFALLAIAVVAVWQLRVYGGPLTQTVRGGVGIDPLLVAAPAIGLLAGGLVATRLLPRLGESAERAFDRGRGLAMSLFARQLGRRPLRYTRVALLIVLATALSTFSAVFAATWSRSQLDQAAYQAAADARLTTAAYPELPTWALGSAYRGVSGIDGATAVMRQRFDVGRSVDSGQILALDADAIRSLGSESDRLTGPAMSRLAAALGDRPEAAAASVPLDGVPARLAVALDTSLTNTMAGADVDSNQFAEVQVAAVLIGPDGLARFAGGTATLGARNQWVEIPLAVEVDGRRFAPTGPVRLEALEIAVAGPGFARIAGQIQLLGVWSNESPDGSDWRPVGLGLDQTGWRWDRVEQQRVTSYQPPAGRPGLIVIGDQKSMTPAVTVNPPWQYGATMRYWAAVKTGAMPALVGPALLDATAAREGETFLASVAGFQSSFRIVAIADDFPTLDPGTPFMVVDREALELNDYAAHGNVDAAGEWWLALASGREADAIATLRGSPYSVEGVVDHAVLVAQIAADPIGLGVVGALILGSAAAVAVAVIGFLVSTTFMARARFRESALLRALGESGRRVGATLILENGLLLAYGLAAGVGVGLMLAWLVVPFTALTPTGALPVPQPEIVVPWLDVAGAAAAGLLILTAVAAALTGAASTGRIAPALRAEEG